MEDYILRALGITVLQRVYADRGGWRRIIIVFIQCCLIVFLSLKMT